MFIADYWNDGKYEIIDKNKENKGVYMKKFDILYNCICLNNSSTELWFDKSTIFTKKILIVVSRDAFVSGKLVLFLELHPNKNPNNAQSKR